MRSIDFLMAGADTDASKGTLLLSCVLGRWRLVEVWIYTADVGEVTEGKAYSTGIILENRLGVTELVMTSSNI